MARTCSSRGERAKTRESIEGELRSEELAEIERPPRQAPVVARPLFGPLMARRSLAVVATHGRRIWLPLRED